MPIKLKGKEGEWSLWLAQIAGYLGGVLTIFMYGGVSFSMLGALAQVAGAAGIIAVVLALYSIIKSK